ncbi:hypothetical protein [Arthrobacter sp. 18067]|uniref:hypothetical protein n=1 Tax=Arthrobacter sp. 18067 TaxID=2681413 RepID=UPI00135B886D|nr:hypothetical protein [Arthrobacter sp. 18067]
MTAVLVLPEPVEPTKENIAAGTAPIWITPPTILEALADVVAGHPSDHANPDRHNSNQISGLTAHVAREFGFTWPELAATKDLVYDLDWTVDNSSRTWFSHDALLYWECLDDLSNLGWTWGAILDHLQQAWINENSDAPF